MLRTLAVYGQSGRKTVSEPPNSGPAVLSTDHGVARLRDREDPHQRYLEVCVAQLRGAETSFSAEARLFARMREVSQIVGG